MTKTSLIRIAVSVLMALPAGAALAQSYPVSGKWTYENPTGEGPARSCGSRYMTFDGQQRFDTGGGVPSYRNISVSQEGDDSYRIVDAFATGQINARSSYTLRKIDADHISLQMTGATIQLRRCG